MSISRDPELDDLFEDPDLAELARLLQSVKEPEPPLDSAFQSALRRQLMQKAWEMTEGRVPWWRRLASPTGLAWSGAAVGTILIASVVVFVSTQAPVVDTHQVFVTSPVADANAVRLEQPILLAFNQPMDHPSTEAAIEIQPATRVSFTWETNTLYVQPAGGNLAPNTQYQVTVGPGAKTAGGQTLAAPQTVRFVTEPAPSPAVSPKPAPALVTGVKELTRVSSGAQPVWSPDGSTIYVLANTTLEAVDAKTGTFKVLALNVTSFALSPSGDQLAYVRNGNVDVLTISSSSTTEQVLEPPASVVSWVAGKVAGKLVWATRDGIYDRGSRGPEKLISLPGSDDDVVSISPDGTHAAYRHVQTLAIFDLQSGKSMVLASAAFSPFFGWSPDGARAMYSVGGGVVIADMDGNTVATLPDGTPSWSTQNEILLGSDTELYRVRPDGTDLIKLADGSFNSPQWAPDAVSFSFVRGGSLWTAKAPVPVPPPSPIDQATTVVKSFMQARLDGSADNANKFLDSAGQAAYGLGGANLILSGDPKFARFFILTSEMTGAGSNGARFVVRLVFEKDKIDVRQFDETLTLQRGYSTDPFRIHAAAASVLRDLGHGPEVVSIDVSQNELNVTFDSDLNPTTVPVSVKVRDEHGKPLTGGITTYASHVVTITGLQLVPGNSYTLAVLTSLRDVAGRTPASEYDLTLLGPVATPNVGATPSPTPSPATPGPATPSPAQPSPAPTPAG